MSSLDVLTLLTDAHLLVVGGTGFLGKVWVCQLLAACPDIGRIHLVVRPKAGLNSEERFWAEVAPSEVFDPLREQHGSGFEAFLREKLDPIPGDVSEPFAGVPYDVRDRLRGTVTALVNVAGVVDFNPPLDDALKVNAFGMKSLVSLARDLGDVPFLHTSTCFVAGERTGQVDEIDPREHPFPKAGELALEHWDPEREIAECSDVVEMVRHRASDAFRQSEFLDEAKRRLRSRGEPERGTALQDELGKVKRRFVEARLADAGRERAHSWGWPNTYTYTKSLGEQVLLASGLPCTIVRPAVVESAMDFPRAGWNEGITTSAPIMYLSMKGMTGMPATDEAVLDIIPVDYVASGMTLALAELLDGSHKPLYQLGTSDTNPLYMNRLIELTGLYKRRKLRGSMSGNPVWNWIQSQYETVPVSVSRWGKVGPTASSSLVQGISGLLKRATADLPALDSLAAPLAAGLDGLAQLSGGTGKVVDQYIPFTATHNYRFDTRNVRAAHARLTAEQQILFPWGAETMDWRDYWLDVHVPGVEKLVWPLIEAKLERSGGPLRAWDDLVSLLDEVAERFDHAPALSMRHADGFANVSYVSLRERAHAAAARLQAAGLAEGDRVLLAGPNGPDWVVAWFGIQVAGGVAVPLDPGLDGPEVANVVEAAVARWAILGDVFAGIPLPAITPFALAEVTAEGPTAGLRVASPGPDALASILFTSGTTGTPKGVSLSHGNFTSLLGSLARLFDLDRDDRVLSVLPLHHTFEFSCGLLLPLSRGTRIVYLDAINAEALSSSLQDARITAMVGVPALWQLLERRIQSQVAERGGLFQTGFDWGLEANRLLGRRAGLDLGRALFGAVHNGLGGHIRLLISGGAALPPETHRFFSGLGLPLAEGYGLTEAAPVLTVSRPSPGARAGTVGKPIPGVELRIDQPDGDGVGEVLARGPNVMQGYFRNAEATAAVLDGGWLRTGDLGRLDHRGRLVVVGRAKDVVVTSSGENVYLDDAEARLGPIPGIAEYTLVGLPDPRGGERLGMLAVPDGEHDAARTNIRRSVSRVPLNSRPAVIHLVGAALPRTATRKVKRNEVATVLSRIADAATPGPDDGGVSAVRHAIAAVASLPTERVVGSTRIADELAFDSLMWVELAAALDQLPGGQPDAETLASCETVADIEALVDAPRALPVPFIEQAPQEDFRFPDLAVEPLKKLLRAGQRLGYERALDIEVFGRAHIPQNRRVLVVANHASHLDFGLVKTALGPYGEGVVGLAAKDYFFEGNPLWVAYFEQLTNLHPLPRDVNYRQSLREAIGVVEQGHVVCIFPEGGRQADGRLREFKPLVGKLVLETGVDVLPMWIEGSHGILPKGAAIPRGRRIQIRIGPALQNAELREAAAAERPGRAARQVAKLLHRSVAALRDGVAFDLQAGEPEAPPVAPLVTLFAEIEGRFRPGGIDQGLCWYFSLAGGDGKWTVTADATSCQIAPGRPAGAADCVIKTSPELWARMVREAYAPSVQEFVGGVIKTSDLDTMMLFAQAFRLGPDPPAAEEASP